MYMSISVKICYKLVQEEEHPPMYRLVSFSHFLTLKYIGFIALLLRAVVRIDFKFIFLNVLF
jgi:hypothetical protein